LFSNRIVHIAVFIGRERPTSGALSIKPIKNRLTRNDWLTL